MAGCTIAGIAFIFLAGGDSCGRGAMAASGAAGTDLCAMTEGDCVSATGSFAGSTEGVLVLGIALGALITTPDGKGAMLCGADARGAGTFAGALGGGTA